MSEFLPLLVVLLQRLTGSTEVTENELADARRQLQDKEVELLAYPADRLEHPNVLHIELRIRSRQPDPA